MKKIKWSAFWLNLVVFLILVFLMMPIFVLVVASFSQEGYLVFPPKGFSLQWYRKFFASAAFISAFKNSVKLSICTTALAMIIGSITAYAIDRSPRRDVLLSLYVSPLMMPSLVIGLALLQYFKLLGVKLSFWTLLIGQLVITIPYVVRSCVASLYRFNVSLEEAAQTLGANRLVTFGVIIVPLLKPSLIASGCFTFISSFGNTAISIFLSTARMTTLPVRLYTYANYTPDPIIAAISSCTLVMTLVLMFIIEKTSGINNL